ncbi:MAG: endonuclease/exonuclease/phosphatase family protein [Planctomycetota bacterium]
MKDATKETSSRPFFSPSVRLLGLVNALGIAACVLPFFGLAARLWWVAELTTHFSWYYAIVLPAFLGVALWRRRWRLALATSAALVIALGSVLPCYLGANDRSTNLAPEAQPLRVMSLNVLTANRRYDRTLDLVAQEDPDVIVLLEVDRPWVEAMSELREHYPFFVERVRADNFGVAFYSRLEPDAMRTVEFDASEVPSVVATFRWQSELVTLIGSHPLPPVSAEQARMRNEHLSAMARFATSQPGEVIVVGDLNITPFSPYFRDLLTDGGLRDSGAGGGYQPTWHTRQGWLGLPIDHALHTPGLVAVGRRVGPRVGSDHRAIIADFALIRGESP